MADHYRTLMVDPGVDDDILGLVYRRLARRYHPDVHAGPDAHRRMREINKAYEVLGDPERRARYDLGRDQDAPPEPDVLPVFTWIEPT